MLSIFKNCEETMSSGFYVKDLAGNYNLVDYRLDIDWNLNERHAKLLSDNTPITIAVSYRIEVKDRVKTTSVIEGITKEVSIRFEDIQTDDEWISYQYLGLMGHTKMIANRSGLINMNMINVCNDEDADDEFRFVLLPKKEKDKFLFKREMMSPGESISESGFIL